MFPFESRVLLGMVVCSTASYVDCRSFRFISSKLTPRKKRDAKEAEGRPCRGGTHRNNQPRIPRVASWRVDRGIRGTCREARNARNAHGTGMQCAPWNAAEGRGRPRKAAEGWSDSECAAGHEREQCACMVLQPDSRCAAAVVVCFMACVLAHCVLLWRIAS